MENCSIQRDLLSKLAEVADAHNIKNIENAFVHKLGVNSNLQITLRANWPQIEFIWK